MVDTIILSGGLGLRLRPLTNNKPKPMIRVGDKPIAEHQIEWLKQSGVKSVVFACGYKYRKIQEHFGERFLGIGIRYSLERERLGTGGAIKQALNSVDTHPFVVVNGDILTELDLKKMITWHESHPFKATIAAIQMTSPYGILDVREGTDRLYGFKEKPVLKNIWINAGVYVFDKEIETELPEIGDIEKITFPFLVEKKALGVYRSYAWWRSVDTVKDVKNLENELR